MKTFWLNDLALYKGDFMSALIMVLTQIGKSLLASLLTEKFLKGLIVFVLEKLVEKTDNKVDDELVAKVKQALYPEQQ